MPGASELAGVHTLRTIDDARRLKHDLASASSVVVVGAGFIGSEVASTCRKLGLDVTIIEADSVPLRRQLGPVMGALAADLHRAHGVRMELGVGVDRLVGDGGSVTGVQLQDGRVIAADVVVVAIGVQPSVSWLEGSGIALDNGVLTNVDCATNIPGVVAVGDVANRQDPFLGKRIRIEHWTSAVEQPSIAASTLLGDEPDTDRPRAPYFWSDQYDVRLQFAGHVEPDDELEIVEGTTEARSFVAVYRRQGRDVAVLGMNQPKLFNRLRRSLAGVEHMRTD